MKGGENYHRRFNLLRKGKIIWENGPFSKAIQKSRIISKEPFDISIFQQNSKRSFKRSGKLQQNTHEEV